MTSRLRRPLNLALPRCSRLALSYTLSNSTWTCDSGRGWVTLEKMMVKATEVRLARAEQENGLTPSM